MDAKKTYYSVADPSAPPVTVEPFTFRVSPFPADTEAGRGWVVWIKYAHGGKWVVLNAYWQSLPEYLDRDGHWVFLSEETRDSVYHSFEVAVRLARSAVLDIEINGYTVQDASERWNK